jgi:uncharacterized protein
MATALITGASSGIGFELAHIHAEKKDNLVLVARSHEKLNELKSSLQSLHGVKVYCIEKDLSVADAAYEIFNQLEKSGIAIDYLINNAGFGEYGFFLESDLKKTEQMIQLNISALTELCHLFSKKMVERKSGKIMNVASTAAFQPGPLMAVYFATKSYVLHFSEALNNELREFGVTVTALCPGPTESKFMEVAKMNESSLIKGRKLPSSRSVAAFGYGAMMKGRPVAIHGFMNGLLANINRFVPRSLTVRITRFLMNKAN